MKKKERQVKAPSMPARPRTVTLKDLKTKNAGSVKGGFSTAPTAPVDGATDADHKGWKVPRP